jgi:hypothetical protein
MNGNGLKSQVARATSGAKKKHPKDNFIALSLCEYRPDLVPEQLRPDRARQKPTKFDASFISETKKTITIRHRDGKTLTIKKVPIAEVRARLKSEMKIRPRKKGRK